MYITDVLIYLVVILIRLVSESTKTGTSIVILIPSIKRYKFEAWRLIYGS